VPVTTPALERLKPVGIPAPITVHVYGASPPVARRVVEYADPNVALGKGETEVIFRAGLITMVKAAVAVCGGMVVEEAWTVKLNVPATAGVPLRVPVDVRLRPGGAMPDIIVQPRGGGPVAAIGSE
jgi:hypothetical protein